MTRLPTAAIAALSLLLAGAARAAVVSGAFSGTIAGNTFDTYGLFGPPGANLSGLTLTAGYSYDTALAFMYVAQPTYDAWLGTDDLTLSVTIGGTTIATTGVTNTEAIDAQAGADTEITLEALAPTPILDFALFAEGPWVPDVTIDAPFILDPCWYQQTIYLSADGGDYDTLNFLATASDFVGTESQGLPAPEPASIAVLGAGLAGIGVLRGRRRGAPSRGQ